MNKTDIHQAFVKKLEQELQDITQAARSSIQTATNNEHVAEDKYDTFSLEASYLARGQAQRVEVLKDSLERLELLPLKPLSQDAPIQLGALIKTVNDLGEEFIYFFSPSAGGEEIVYRKKEIMLITSSSPLGKALVGKRKGEEAILQLGPDIQTLHIVSVK